MKLLHYNTIKMIGFRKFSTTRKPTLGDIVIISDSKVCKEFSKCEKAVVISYDPTDTKFTYQVRVDESFLTPWLGANDIILANPNAPVPLPQPPGPNECCGSQCPNCGRK
jgi:hypothetical protein